MKTWTIYIANGPKAVNYGCCGADWRPQQSVGGRHDIVTAVDDRGAATAWPPIQRYGTRSDGSRVDLLDWIEQHDDVPSEFTNLFRGGAQS